MSIPRGNDSRIDSGFVPRVRLGGFLGDPGKGTNPARALISYIQSRQRINASDVKQFTFVRRLVAIFLGVGLLFSLAVIILFFIKNYGLVT